MSANNRIFIYDTTLRDGLQRHNITCTFEDKIKICQKLAQMDIPFVEGGWPGANPVDTKFFEYLKENPLSNTQVVAFGSTRRPHTEAESDSGLKSLLNAETLWVTVFGKSWDFHAKSALRVSLEENLLMIQDTVSYLRANHRRVIYDAEHWFDGYKANPAYALQTLSKALVAGAEWLVLCDTNGGTLPDEISLITSEVHQWLQEHCSDFQSYQLGIHTHNDAGTAIAGGLAAVKEGVRMVQGTFNGYGERCGNADLCTLIPNLQLKMQYDCIKPSQLKCLVDTSRYISETLNIAPDSYAPYVGQSAFAHKGGIHISAVERDSKTYEHVSPSLVGNERQIVISSYSGMSTIISKARAYGITLSKGSHLARKIVERVKVLESKGYQFEAADASFELVMLRELGLYLPAFQQESFNVSYGTLQGTFYRKHRAQATIKISISGVDVLEVAECIGPISALDKALRKALVQFYPTIDTFQLTDYKVRILNSEAGANANIRVLVESSNGTDKWSTIGVSVNILEASYQAVVSGLEYGLYRFPSYRRSLSAQAS